MIPKTDPPIYLLVGKEKFLKDEFIRELRRRLFPDSTDPGFNFQEFTAGKDSAGAVLDFLKTAPFLSKKRLAIFREMDRLGAEDREHITAYVQNPSPTGILVLVSDEGSVKKDTVLRKLSQETKLVSCHPPFDRELPLWIETRVKKTGKVIEKEAARALLERVGKGIADLASAIEVLSVYVGERNTIAQKDVETLLGRSIQGDVYALVDRLIEKNSKKTLETLELLFKEGARFQEIIGALAGQLDRLKQAREFLDARRAPSEIASELGVHPFYFERLLSQAKAVSVQGIRESLKRLLVCDESVKSGKVNDRTALERFILELCV